MTGAARQHSILWQHQLSDFLTRNFIHTRMNHFGLKENFGVYFGSLIRILNDVVNIRAERNSMSTVIDTLRAEQTRLQSELNRVQQAIRVLSKPTASLKAGGGVRPPMSQEQKAKIAAGIKKAAEAKKVQATSSEPPKPAATAPAAIAKVTEPVKPAVSTPTLVAGLPKIAPAPAASKPPANK
jgi:hypothetical protein